ncbi:hypothetical protein N665_0276s0014 [Sinapis alba]|nr:hypothetical protein N665_0276s0014 [Sinapis alba]
MKVTFKPWFTGFVMLTILLLGETCLQPLPNASKTCSQFRCSRECLKMHKQGFTRFPPMSFEEEENEEETFEHTLLVVCDVSSEIEPHLWDTSVANGFSPIKSGPVDS